MDEHSSLLRLILESNLINFLVVLGLIIFFSIKYLPSLSKNKQNQILKNLEDAKEARKAAEEKLKELEKKIEEAKEESKKILIEAESSAEKLKLQIDTEAKKQSESIMSALERDLEAAKAVSIEEIKRSILNAALKLAEEKFKNSSGNESIVEAFKKEIAKEIKS